MLSFKDVMKRMVLLIVATGIVLLGVVAVLRKSSPRPVAAPQYVASPPSSTVTNAATVSNPAPVAVVAPPAAPAEKLPKGWEDFRKLREIGQLNRVTAAMENRTLPADLLAFFEQEIFNRQHWDVTRNNMANALVWQETPNPRLHELFATMLADETESPVWRDYCLQFLSECLKSSSDPEAIKAILARYAQGKDGLAGTAIVNIGLQEGAGRIKPDETFSQQLEAQLTDPEVVTPTKLSILGMIGKRHDVRLLPLVRSYAVSTNDSLRRTAMATLGLIGTRDDLPLLQPGLTNRNRAVQMAAKGAIARIEGQ
jgi:hypothetical protein